MEIIPKTFRNITVKFLTNIPIRIGTVLKNLEVIHTEASIKYIYKY